VNGAILFPNYEALQGYETRFPKEFLLSYPWANKEKASFLERNDNGLIVHKR
jgi:hypothetical protein